MSIPFPVEVTKDSVFLWIIHRFAEVYKEHAILKGGMALRLLNSSRSTNDLDYVFVPYDSKKDIIQGLLKILNEIPGAHIVTSFSSKAIHILIKVQDVSVQVEANVAQECKSSAISTTEYARELNETGRMVRIMRLDVALSNKLAAWYERRLYRDLYDVYFLFRMVNVMPHIDTLLSRLEKIQSRIPRLKQIKKISLSKFISELEDEIHAMSQKNIEEQLSPLFKREEYIGLDIKMKAALNTLLDKLKDIHRFLFR